MIVAPPTANQLSAEVVQELEQRMQYQVGWWALTEIRNAQPRTAEYIITQLIESMAVVLQRNLTMLAMNVQFEIDSRLGDGKPLEALSNEEIEQRCTALMKLLSEREAAEKRHG